MPRTKVEPDALRTPITIRVNAIELERLSRAAEIRGVKVSAFIRSAALRAAGRKP